MHFLIQFYLIIFNVLVDNYGFIKHMITIYIYLDI